MNIVITGGAGYIGSHMARVLAAQNHTITVVDTLEHGYRQAVPGQCTFMQGDVGNPQVLETIFVNRQVDAVIHFAGYISVEESVNNPQRYYTNNVVKPLVLLESMAQHEVKHIIFSSTAAVYGNPTMIPIPENHPKLPTSPYGLSKYFFEETLRYYEQKAHIRSISLRYFNAAGGALDGQFGEAHEPETHIIPLAIRTALGKQKEFVLYGTDYATADGTCERDYIHVEDLCSAHICALTALAQGHSGDVYNVGTGVGITNRQVIDMVSKVSGVPLSLRETGKRAGDPDRLVADSTKIQRDLGWKPKYSDLPTIVESAWQWHKSHPNGYV